MWFVFPQIAGLGFSEMARFYAIADLVEARAYLAHPVLGPRLTQSVDAMLAWNGLRGAGAILGPVDALKFASSMTLFEAVHGGDIFARALDVFYTGRRDGRTLELVDKFVPQAG
ncbi:MAG: calpastatin [Novosphingobium sp.]|nr:calpastatin [Novosphingobium sp.]